MAQDAPVTQASGGTDMVDTTELKARMQARRAELLARASGIEEELDSHHDPDWSDLATQRESDEVLEGLGLSAAHEVRMINAALARMEAGTYGTCARCGEMIGAARLEALFYTPLCRDCAAQA
jgi:RNA polymerase-binding transcription factor DksA